MLTGDQFQLIVIMLFILTTIIVFVSILVLSKLDNIHNEVIERISNEPSKKRLDG